MEIKLENLGYSYGKHSRALSNVNAVLGPGMHLLLGANGAGKTTLLRLVAGLLFPSEGKCLIDGGPTRHRLPSVLSKLFYLGTNMQLPAANINELVRVHGQFYPTLSPTMLAENLREFGIDPDMKFAAMSMGMRQKASAAYALALQTPILLLDEPATGLDIESKRTLQRLMLRCIAPEATVIVSTHNFADLEPLYDGLMVLDRGRLLLCASLEEITGRLCFVSGAGPAPEDALFSLQRHGQTHSIIRNPDNRESDIDFELLYLALKQHNEIFS